MQASNTFKRTLQCQNLIKNFEPIFFFSESFSKIENNHSTSKSKKTQKKLETVCLFFFEKFPRNSASKKNTSRFFPKFEKIKDFFTNTLRPLLPHAGNGRTYFPTSFLVEKRKEREKTRKNKSIIESLRLRGLLH